MESRVAFYVHHHGRGHVSRTRALLEHLELPATVLTSADVDPTDVTPAGLVRLPMDTADGSPQDHAATPSHMHHAPLGVPGLRQRTAAITHVLSELAPALLVVDVSAEVAQLGRHAGTPTAVVRQHGRRWDPAHVAAYDGAVGLLAPFGPELEEPDAPAWVRDKTFYAGGFGLAPERTPPRRQAREQLGWDTDGRIVVVLSSDGGDGPTPEEIAAAAAATPDHRWVAVGRDDVGGDVTNVGWVDDPVPYLAAADVVVASAGHNAVMEVASAARPLVCVPEPRPFAEQRRKAARLRALDAAEVAPTWPDPQLWPAVIERAERRGSARLSSLVDPEGASRAAGWIAATVRRCVARYSP